MNKRRVIDDDEKQKANNLTLVYHNCAIYRRRYLFPYFDPNRFLSFSNNIYLKNTSNEFSEE